MKSILVTATLVFVLCVGQQAAASIVPGDVDGSGSTDIADVQCAVLAVLANLESAGLPTCLPTDGAADANCDSHTNITDVSIVIQMILGTGPDPFLDSDGDGVVDDCYCTDNVLCTEDAGPAGNCIHTAKDDLCDDENICTDDLCDGDVGCIHSNNTFSCDDGDACTVQDTCTEGACVAIDTLICDDGNACTEDSCDQLEGCLYVPNTLPCDDGYLCTQDDVCTAGSCVGVLTQDLSLGISECGYPETIVCVPDTAPGATTVCPLSLVAATQTTPYATQLQFSIAKGSFEIDGFYDIVCILDNLCFEMKLGTVAAVLSTGHTVLLADSGDTVSVAITSLGVAALTKSHLSSEGDIVGDPVFIDVHFTGTGTLETTLPSLQPVEAWTDQYMMITDIHPGGLIETDFVCPCDDGNACTEDSCDLEADCVFTPINCEAIAEPWNPCLEHSCDPIAGCQSSLIDCGEETPCKNYYCNQSTGECLSVSTNCSDGDVCTLDYCHPTQGCKHIFQPETCSDDDPCTNDLCGEECIYEPNTGNPCSDGDVCTASDTCVDGTCVGMTGVVCDDGDPCTVDICNEDGSCWYEFSQTDECNCTFYICDYFTSWKLGCSYPYRIPNGTVLYALKDIYNVWEWYNSGTDIFAFEELWTLDSKWGKVGSCVNGTFQSSCDDINQFGCDGVCHMIASWLEPINEELSGGNYLSPSNQTKWDYCSSIPGWEYNCPFQGLFEVISNEQVQTSSISSQPSESSPTVLFSCGAY